VAMLLMFREAADDGWTRDWSDAVVGSRGVCRMSAPQPSAPNVRRTTSTSNPRCVLLVSGGVRDRSTNTAVLRTIQALAPPDVEAFLFKGILLLPHFNPDDDTEGAPVPDAVARMREAVRSADALLICTPEYAGAMPAVLKTCSSGPSGTRAPSASPVGWINASIPAAPTGGADAHESLDKVLRCTGADIVASA
jgi:chromate reductase, NAD(P)H dehydrogenase (quinone)